MLLRGGHSRTSLRSSRRFLLDIDAPGRDLSELRGGIRAVSSDFALSSDSSVPPDGFFVDNCEKPIRRKMDLTKSLSQIFQNVIFRPHYSSLNWEMIPRSSVFSQPLPANELPFLKALEISRSLIF